MPSRRTILRLQDIIDDADRISAFVDGMTLADFIADEKTILAVERLLQRITEAAVQIEPADAARIGAGLPVAAMRALGNRLRHEYRDIDRRIIFEIVRDEVPSLRAAATLALAQP